MKDKPKKVKEPVLEIIGLIDEPRWKKLIPCICLDQHDLRNCKHCKYQDCEDSLPRKPWSVNLHDGKKALIKKIIITRGIDEDIMGWEGVA
jgi:hypothetical protein